MQDRKKIVYVLGFIFLVSTMFMSYKGISVVANTSLILCIEFGIVFFLLRHRNRFYLLSHYYPSFNFIVLFSLLPVFTWISCYLAHGQEIYYSFGAFVPHYLLLTYFIMTYYNVRAQSIINIIIFFALLRTGITFIEQFTYPNVPFSFRTERYNIYGNLIEMEQRNGFYRFLIADAYAVVLFTVFYAFVQITKHLSIKYLLLFLISCFGIYMDGSRQVMIAAIVPMVLYPFIKTGHTARLRSAIFIGLFLLIVGYAYADVLWDELLLKTQNQSADSFGRFFSFSYFMDNIWNIEAIFGNGIGFSDTTQWGRTLNKLHDNQIRPHDVGILGAIFMVGWVIVLSFLIYLWCIVVKKWKYIDDTLRLYYISLLIMIPFIFPLYNGTLPVYEMFLAFLFYLTDKSIMRYKN